jgi:hypothetical protein
MMILETACIIFQRLAMRDVERLRELAGAGAAE